jgi:hypothetical protein
MDFALRALQSTCELRAGGAGSSTADTGCHAYGQLLTMIWH